MNSNLSLMGRELRQYRVFTATSTTSNPRQFKGLIIEYVGAQVSALLTVGATTLVAAIGATGAEAADPNFTVGAAPGTIDLTNAAADTAGELSDFINNLTDWKCRLVGLRRSDAITTSGYFVAASTQQAKVSGGYAVNIDVAVAKHITAEISILDGQMYKGGPGSDPGTKTLRRMSGIEGDYKKVSVVELLQVDETLTYTGTGTFEVIEVDDFNQTDEVIYSSTIPAATTVAGTKSFGALGGYGSGARPGRRLLVRCRGASTLSAVTNFAVFAVVRALYG